MAKDRRKVSHIHSKIQDRQPTPASLEYGELGVNYNADHEFISMKNSDDKVVRFSSDAQMIDIMEKKEVMPYKGYVRGETGPSSTSGDTPTADAYGSYGITNDDLLNNKSEIVVKLNQVAASATTKHDKVNGAKDKYGKLVNPTTDDGLNDGAGFFIDMSRYAMNGANPSFSSITVTDKSDLSGNTTIANGDGTGTRTGHTLTIKTTDVNSTNTNWNEEITNYTGKITNVTETIGTNDTTISGNTVLNVSGTTTETKKGNVTETNLADKVENTSGNSTVNINGNYVGNTTGTTTEIKKGNVKEYHSGTTEETKSGVVTETNLSTKTETTTNQYTQNNKEGYTVNTTGDVVTNTTGTTTETKVGNVTENHSGTTTENKSGAVVENNLNTKTENTTGKHSIYSTGDTCVNSQTNANFYGKTSTNIGVACDGTTKGGATTVYGTTTTISGSTTNVTGATTLNISGNTINEKSLTSNTNTNVANTTVENTATTTIGTANTTINSAKTDISTATTNVTAATTTVSTANTTISSAKTAVNTATTNITAATTTISTATTTIDTASTTITSAKTNITTATTTIGTANVTATTGNLTGSTLTVNEGTSVTVNAPSTTISGSNTTIKSCNKVEIITDNFGIKQCPEGTGGSAEFEFCDGYKVKSNKIELVECANGGAFGVSSTTMSMSGGTLSTTSTGNTEINADGRLGLTAKGDLTAVSTESSMIITANKDICETAGSAATFYGVSKTNLGLNCSESSVSTTTNLYGTTINEKATTANVSANTANTTVTAATTTINTANTTISSTTTTIGTANTTINTANITASTTNLSGVTLDVKESNVNITATTGTNINSGTFTSKSTGATTISGASITETSTADTTINVGGKLTEKVTGTTTINRTGAVTENNSNGLTVTTTGKTCVQSTTDLNIGGDASTNVGVACDGSVYSNNVNIYAQTGITETADTVTITGTTSVTVKGSTVSVSGKTTNITGATELNITGSTINVDAIDYDLDANNVCVSAATKANFYGKTTNIGVDCNGSTTATETNINASTAVTVNAPTTNITGKTNISGDTVIGGKTNISGDTTIKGATTINGKTTINNDLIVTGKTNISGVTTIGNTTTINGATTINNNLTVTGNTNINGKLNVTGDTTINGKLIIPNNCTAKISSTDVSAALCEIFDDSVVTMTKDENPSDSGLSAVYKLYQNGQQIGYDINVPKDGFLKKCELIESGNTFYLHFIWNVYDAGGGTYGSGETYVNVEDLVKDIDENNNKTDRGVNVDVWYNETDKKMNVSADTTINLRTTTGNAATAKTAGQHYLSATTLTIVNGPFSGGTYNPHDKSLTIGIPESPGDVGLGKNLTFTTGQADVSQSPYNGQAAKTITIPKNMSDIQNRGTLTLSHDTQVSSYTPGDTTSISFSHKSLKFKHNGKDVEYNPSTENNAGTLPHSSLTLTYGTSCGKSGSVTYDTSGAISATIPTNVSHLGRATLKYEYGSTASKTASSNGTYDPGEKTNCNGEISDTIVIPTGVGDINRGKLNVNHGNDNFTWDPVGDSSFTLSHSALTLTYGKTSDKSGSVTYSTTASSSVNIPTSVSDINRGTLSISHCGDSINWDPVANSSITMSHGTLTIKKNSTEVGTYNACDDSEIDISVPTCVNQLNRHKITFQSGSTTGFTSSQTYDPGKDCANSAETINIPTDVCHLNRGKLTIQKNSSAIDTFDPCSDKTINISVPTSVGDITRGKLTIQKNGSTIDTFDPSTDKTINISVPTSVGDITRGKLSIEHCGDSINWDPVANSSITMSHGTLTIKQGSSTLGTYSACSDSTITIPASPTSVCDLTRGTLTLTQSGVTLGTFDPCTSTTIDIPGGGGGDVSGAKVCYDNTCNLTGCVTHGSTGFTVPATVSHVTCGDIEDISAGTNSNTINIKGKFINITGGTNSSNAGGINISHSGSTHITSNEGVEIKSPLGNIDLSSPWNGGGGVGDVNINAGHNANISSETSTNIDSLGDTTIKASDDVSISARTTSVKGYNSACLESTNGKVNVGGKQVNIGYNCADGQVASAITMTSSNSINITGDKFINLTSTNDGDSEIMLDAYGSILLNCQDGPVEIRALNDGSNFGIVNVYSDNSNTIESKGTNTLTATGSTIITTKNANVHINAEKTDSASQIQGNVFINGDTNIALTAEKNVNMLVSGNYVTWNGSVLTVNGNINADGAIYSSDRNLKENIHSINDSKLNAAIGIRPVSFNFKDDENKRLTYGVIAQDIEALGLDELVHTREDGTLGVDYTSLLILKNASLEREIRFLHGRLRDIEKKLKELTNDKKD